MCGIIALWNGNDTALVNQMLEKIQYRGPDGRGLSLVSGVNAALGHQRLAIIDISGGEQPILSDTGNATIVHNGEIYNDLQLRDTLSKQYNFTTSSDSESLMHALQVSGVDAGPLLDGMFSFVAVVKGELIVGRDPLGIKPLYTGNLGATQIFASEIKALDGLVENISEFPPGTLYSSNSGFKRYYDIPYLEPINWNAEDAVVALREKLTCSVVKRLRSDVPVGAFLSGGLDSSIIAAIAKSNLKELHTFSVGVQGSPDLIAARSVSSYLGTIHHEHVITQSDIEKHLPLIIYHLESYDQDLVRNAIPCYFASLIASKHVKVVLTGEGADELFAGYGYHKEYQHDKDLHDELRRSLGTMHNINLQRVDRMTMAVGLEGRVPFLDTEVISLALSIPASLKIKRNTSSIIQKWVLRKAFDDLLPHDIVWREKTQFAVGSGIADLMDKPYHDVSISNQAPALRSQEERYYHQLFTKSFSDIAAVSKLVGRWEKGRVNVVEAV